MTNGRSPSAAFNPFTESAAGEYFVGREGQLSQYRAYLEGLRAGHPIQCYVAGVHGTGKTSFLCKLVEIAAGDSLLAVIPTIEEQHGAREQINEVLRSIVKGLQDHIGRQSMGQGDGLVADWDKGQGSRQFRFPRTSTLSSNIMKEDLETLSRLIKGVGLGGTVICIDEAQRIDPRALSGLKNALQHLNSYLLVLSLLLVVDTGGAILAGRNLLDEKAQAASGDIGASRFFVGSMAMGPFDTEEEAIECVELRLKGNAIQFDENVVKRVCQISERIPRSMIRFGSLVYDAAVREQCSNVDTRLINRVFRSANRAYVQEAVRLCEGISDNACRALRGLLELGGVARPEEIAAHLYPEMPDDSRAYVISGIDRELTRVHGALAFCTKEEDCYAVSNPVHAYALKLALGMEKP